MPRVLSWSLCQWLLPWWVVLIVSSWAAKWFTAGLLTSQDWFLERSHTLHCLIDKMEGSVYQLLSTVHGTFGSPGNLQIKLLESILLGQPALSSLFLSCLLQQWGKCLGEIRYCHSEFPKWILVTIDLECQNTSPGVSGRLQCFRCKWRLREKQASALKSNYCEEPTQPTVSIHSFSYSG